MFDVSVLQPVTAMTCFPKCFLTTKLEERRDARMAVRSRAADGLLRPIASGLHTLRQEILVFGARLVKKLR